mgnify:CR=1 FL=1
MFGDIVKGAEAATEASTGEPAAVVKFCIIVLCSVFAWLGVLSTSLIFFGVSLSGLREKRAADMKEVYAKCEPKYETLAKVETKCDSLKESISKLEINKAVIDKDLTNLDIRMTSIEDTFTKMCQEMKAHGETLIRIETKIGERFAK